MFEFICIFLACYALHALGVTIGYHRLLSHRSFSCPKIVEYFWVMLGYLAFEGSPIWWATIHRAHHRYVDTALDPHSPRYGTYNAHVGWLTRKGYPAHINPRAQAKDLIDDPFYAFLEQGGSWHRAHALAFAVGLLARLPILFIFGWQAALASLLAAAAVLQIPLMLNVICHLPKLGYKNYARNDDSVNVWWVAILAMGEGWHNNHHAFPGSAKTGIKSWEFDLSWLIILLMRKLHLVSAIHTAAYAPHIRTTQQITACRVSAAPAVSVSPQRHASSPASLHS
ncbi:MAG TPA: fatty acid desaturase [Candidatus Obscuribacterales bacterium]